MGGIHYLVGYQSLKNYCFRKYFDRLYLLNQHNTMVEALPEITIKDEEDEFQLSKFKGEYEKIYRDAVEYTDPIIKALNGLPVYHRYHIKNGLALGKGLKIIRYQDFTKKRKQSQKRKETKRNEGRVNKKRRVEDVEDVEDVETFVNQFAKRLCIDDV